MLQVLGAVALGFVLGNKRAQETLNNSISTLGASAVDFLAKTDLDNSGDDNAQETDINTQIY